MSVAVIKGVTSAVGMTFGLRKCATVYMREGKMTLTLPDKTRREEIKEEVIPVSRHPSNANNGHKKSQGQIAKETIMLCSQCSHNFLQVKVI